MWIYFDLSCSLLECTLYLRTPISLTMDSPQQFIYFFKSSFSLLPPFSSGTYTRRMLEPFNCTIYPAARVIDPFDRRIKKGTSKRMMPLLFFAYVYEPLAGTFYKQWDWLPQFLHIINFRDSSYLENVYLVLDRFNAKFPWFHDAIDWPMHSQFNNRFCQLNDRSSWKQNYYIKLRYMRSEKD